LVSNVYVVPLSVLLTDTRTIITASLIIQTREDQNSRNRMLKLKQRSLMLYNSYLMSSPLFQSDFLVSPDGKIRRPDPS